MAGRLSETYVGAFHFITMFTLLRILSSTLHASFRALCYPFKVVFSSIFKALPSRPCQTGDAEVLGISSQPTSINDCTTVNEGDSNALSHVEIIEVRRYYPPGVSEIIGRGGECFIGAINDSTVLKYPCIPGNNEGIYIEAQLLEVLGSHPRIIASKGLTEYGLTLQRASNGSLSDHIASESFIPPHQRLLWCKQAAEAVSYIHSKHVIHCDINLRNFLLDENFDLLLADFQGMLKSVDGKTLLDGLSRECSKSYMPRCHGDFACVKTDLFALGSAIYFIMTGHEVFPELDSLDDDEEILSRFQNGIFPVDYHLCYDITNKCWTQCYQSADDLVSDLSLIQASKGFAE
ncbi:kinase-like domain-containing protein [Aspergillus coremiiformis]|uniref:Kinase-like domain-containing protein n=1 Tax=Aspergillus coremiiformis TaxID=138285 RepID=A0A5N6ZAU1_9EURO|nr:kinase-like domain-containing protein [Aspergillus coremiiformis]